MNTIKRIALTIVAVFALLATTAYANHPVLVEGNCDSPVPGTTILPNGGPCGDFDGDGRIGTSEDTDGLDRIFGTLEAAIGPGTGSAAGRGANYNGTVTIVTSGRFYPLSGLSIPDAVSGPTHLTIEAAPGVLAAIDAVFQGDPAGGNTQRQNIAAVNITATGLDDRIVLRNLVFRNWTEGVRSSGGATVTIDNCKFERNLDYAIRALGSTLLIVYESTIVDTGFRVGGNVPTAPLPGRGISFEGSSRGLVAKSSIYGSAAEALSNTSLLGVGAVSHYQLVIGANASGIVNATAINY